MSWRDYATAMAAYNRWMNERLYAVCAEIPDAERKRDRGAFFKSIHGTLNHILVGDKLWLGRFLDEPFPVESLDQELYADFDALRAERERTDAVVIEFVGDLGGQLGAAVADGITHRVLHPTIGGQNPDCRKVAGTGNQPHYRSVGFAG